MKISISYFMAVRRNDEFGHLGKLFESAASFHGDLVGHVSDLSRGGGIASTRAVRMIAGARALMVMPDSAYSLPMDFVIPTTAALEEEYATMPALPSFPAMEATLRIT